MLTELAVTKDETKERVDPPALHAPAGAADCLMAAPTFPDAVGFLAQSFVAGYESAPRASALFATQQRWLLSLAALSGHYGADGAGMSRRSIAQSALKHLIASRNTAYAFFDEILKYGIVLPMPGRDLSKELVVVPSPDALAILVQWCDMHLAALDRVDAGTRSERFRAAPDRLLPLLMPPLSEGLLANPHVRMPGPLYRIFAWTDAGGLLMDRLVAGIDRQTPWSGGHLTDVVTIAELARAFSLSRAHTSRKFAEAEAIGGIGWSGRRGYSPLWISRGFFAEYAMMQARKLLIFQAAFAVAEA
ncbi:hypothetical protein [Shinella sp.]|uniref:hypothetical protein n=1 Tax=Shinella sp. TaxID=1870904 RepID=UPI0028AEB5D8|nr:hypothetical protein [Shinella sp.]